MSLKIKLKKIKEIKKKKMAIKPKKHQSIKNRIKVIPQSIRK